VADPQSTFMTIEEVAELLRLSERSVYGLARKGELPGAVKVGRSWRVERATLMESLRKPPVSSEGG
jgi:excisionase family DNA binding protein